MAILVDTSIWVDHFRRRNAELVQLLAEDRVWCHPLVIGEMACGTPPQRERTLAELGLLRQAQDHRVAMRPGLARQPGRELGLDGRGAGLRAPQQRARRQRDGTPRPSGPRCP